MNFDTPAEALVEPGADVVSLGTFRFGAESFSQDGVGDESSDLVVREGMYFETGPASFGAPLVNAASFLAESFSHDGVAAVSLAGAGDGALDVRGVLLMAERVEGGW